MQEGEFCTNVLSSEELQHEYSQFPQCDLPTRSVINAQTFLQHQNYFITDIIAGNKSSIVFRALKQGEQQYHNEDVAIKMSFCRNKKVIESYNQEVEMAQRILDDHLLKVYEVLFDQQNESVFVVMELCLHGDLQSLLMREGDGLSKEQILQLSDQILQSIQTLHQHDILHNDINPFNFLIDSNQHLKLSYLNCSKFLFNAHDSSHTFLPNTYYYSSRQRIEKLRAQTFAEDLFGVGATILVLCGCKIEENYNSLFNIREGGDKELRQHCKKNLLSLFDIGCSLLLQQEQDCSIQLINARNQIQSLIVEQLGSNGQSNYQLREEESQLLSLNNEKINLVDITQNHETSLIEEDEQQLIVSSQNQPISTKEKVMKSLWKLIKLILLVLRSVLISILQVSLKLLDPEESQQLQLINSSQRESQTLISQKITILNSPPPADNHRFKYENVISPQQQVICEYNSIVHHNEITIEKQKENKFSDTLNDDDQLQENSKQISNLYEGQGGIPYEYLATTQDEDADDSQKQLEINTGSSFSDEEADGDILIPSQENKMNENSSTQLVQSPSVNEIPQSQERSIPPLNLKFREKHNSSINYRREMSLTERPESSSNLQGKIDIIVFPNGYYIGEILNKQPHGEGKMYFHKGNRYEGKFLNGLYEGLGTYFYAGGNKYTGEWKKNLREGEGTYRWADGAIYAGGYKNNVKSGRGVLTLPNKQRYEGQFLSNCFWGEGKLYFEDGSYFVGKFSKGERVKQSGEFFQNDGQSSQNQQQKILPQFRKYQGHYLTQQN